MGMFYCKFFDEFHGVCLWEQKTTGNQLFGMFLGAHGTHKTDAVLYHIIALMTGLRTGG